MSSSDFSGLYALTCRTLDGNTLISNVAWGKDMPDVYRNGTLALPGDIGRLPVLAFTRSALEVGNTASPIAKTGAVIVARGTGLSGTASIGVIPRGSNNLSQLQPLSAELSARLWALPGDHLYLNDPGGAAGGDKQLHFYVRPINFPELDKMLPLPPPKPDPAAFVIQAVNAGDIPYSSTATKVIYMVEPPAADTVYTLPAPAVVPSGQEQVFVGMNARSFVLDCFALNGGLESAYYVPARGVVTMIACGSVYAPLGTPSNRAILVNDGNTIDTPFRGVRRYTFLLGANGNFALPDPAVCSGDAVLSITTIGVGNPTLTGSINGNFSQTLTLHQGVILRPFGLTWQGTLP